MSELATACQRRSSRMSLLNLVAPHAAAWLGTEKTPKAVDISRHSHTSTRLLGREGKLGQVITLSRSLQYRSCLLQGLYDIGTLVFGLSGFLHVQHDLDLEFNIISLSDGTLDDRNPQCMGYFDSCSVA